MGKTTFQHTSTTPMVTIFSRQRLAEYIYVIEERGWVPTADSCFLFVEVQSSAAQPDWNLCLHSLSGQTGRPYFHTQVLSKENLLQRPLA